MGIYLSPGKLRNKVEIQAVVLTKDKYGGEIRTWTTFATMWASISAQKSSGADESSDGNMVKRSALFDVSIRYRSDITGEHRVLHGEKVYAINKVTDVENRKIILVLECNSEG